MKKLLVYRSRNGHEPFTAWLLELRDRPAKARVQMRIFKLREGSSGDAKPVGGGVMELRIHLGPGYRVYYALQGDAIVLLLCAGTKGTQQADIRRARVMWDEWKRR